MVDAGKEAVKVGVFALVVAGLAAICKKLEGTWAGIVLLRGETSGKRKGKNDGA